MVTPKGDEGYTNKFPDDAGEMAVLIRKADLQTAIRLMQVWGSKQRDIGSIKALASLASPTLMTREIAEELSRRAT